MKFITTFIILLLLLLCLTVATDGSETNVSEGTNTSAHKATNTKVLEDCDTCSYLFVKGPMSLFYEHCLD